MTQTPNLKAQLLELATNDLEQFLGIIGVIGYQGYLVYKYKLTGHSLQQCANKYGITKRQAQGIVDKCNANGYGAALFKLNMLK